MTRWIILGGAVVLASGLAVLAAWVPALFHGWSGLVIRMFLGFCSIIVVAQFISALRDLARRLPKPFVQRSARLVRGEPS